MKSWQKIALGITSLLLLTLPQLALAYTSSFESNWNIKTFDTDILAKKDGSLIVTETIVADFSKEKHHGIYRTIPIRYKDGLGNNFALRYRTIRITNENDEPWNYEKSNEGEYVYLKIGDPDIYLNEPTTFKISYQIERAISYFSDHDEIYWNSTGTEWEVPILSATATITLPEKINKNDLKGTCYTGSYGSSEKNCSVDVQENLITSKITTPLNGGEGLTVAVSMPKGIIQQPGILEQILPFLEDNWSYSLPIIFFLILIYLWFTRGRDPKGDRTTIMPRWEPPDNLTPTEIGTIIDEKVDIRDISASIIDLAIRGYLQIKELTNYKHFKNEYEFKRLKEFKDDPKLKDYEKKILEGIFKYNNDTIKLSDLNNEFYKNIPIITSATYSTLVNNGYFPTNPDDISSNYYAIGAILVFVSFFTFGFSDWFGYALGLNLIISGILFLIFAKFMPAKTKKGVNTFYEIRGLEEYIKTAEKDRLKFSEKENIFEKLLPHAMALGIADRWCKTFEGIYRTPPNWYSSANPNFMNHFTTMYLLNNLSSLSSNMNSTFVSSPRSSGNGSWRGGSGFSGGFSGGGFGGGGGGAW